MTVSSTFQGLAGQLLLAMPGMKDPRFHRAVIFVCAHDPSGAMGLMLNQPVPGMALVHLMDQLDIPLIHTEAGAMPVFNGGPVETGRGFVLHGPDFRQKETVIVNDFFSVTATVDALSALGAGIGPKESLFMLGYAGWTAGQLEAEIADNTWLTAPATPEVVFSTPPTHQWDTAMHILGVDPSHLSGFAGRA